MTFGRPLIFLVDIKIGLKTFGETASTFIFQNMAHQLYSLLYIIITVFLLQIMHVFLNKLMHLPTIVVFLHL